MNMSGLINIVACLFLLMAVGYIARKLGIIDNTLSKGLSRLIIRIGQPFLIINSLTKTAYSPEGLREGLIILGLGFVLHAFMAIYAYFACRPIRELDEQKLSEFSLVFTNCGFIGFPILESIMGPQGLFLGAFFFVSFHVLTWTWGLLILARGRNDIRPRLKNILLNFGTVPCAIGLTIYIARIPMPEFVQSLTGYLAALCTPISVLITGGLLATMPPKAFFTTRSLYSNCLHKLIIIPLLVCVIMHFCGIPDEYTLFCTVIAALPSAAVVTMFGETYDIRPNYAALTVGVTSVLSVITLPCIIWIAQWIMG